MYKRQTQHRVEYETLYRLVLNKIRECAKAALMDGEAVAGRLTNTCEAEQKGQREALERSLTKHEERIEVLEKMVLRLYEDMVAGRISEANFNLMPVSYTHLFEGSGYGDRRWPWRMGYRQPLGRLRGGQPCGQVTGN